MTRRITDRELRSLRNEVDVTSVIHHLEIPWKISEGHVRFLCPRCSDFHTATNPETNLARCFRCKQNFNPIDLVMTVHGLDFLGAIRWLRRCRGASPRPPPID